MLSIRTAAISLILTALLVVLSSRQISILSQGSEPAITLVAAGDVLFARSVGTKISRYGKDWPFQKVASTIRSADIAFCNLECPLSAKGIKVNKLICFKADPANVKCLTNAGFDIVSLANNHALDCSRTGLTETMRVLDKAGIAYTGSGKTLADAAQPTILEVKGVKVAFLARNAWMPESTWYRQDVPGIAPLESSAIEQEIRDAKSKADVVIVSLHWGVEYSKTPSEEQVKLAHKMIDAGADLVLGHHPHVTQKIEKYHGGVIAYSLGNFLFDSRNPLCMDSMILKCRLSKSGVSFPQAIPVRIADYLPVL